MSEVEWWNSNYKFRKPVDFENNTQDSFPLAAPISVLFRKDKTLDVFKMRSDFQDVEVVHFDGVNHNVLGRSIAILPDVTEANFDGEEDDPTYPYTPIEVSFDNQFTFNDKVQDTYFVYYGNYSQSLTSSRPAYTKNVWPISVTPGGVGFSYLKPNEDWTSGISDKPGARVSFTFYGNKVRILAHKNSTSGFASIKLDNGDSQSVDLYSSSSTIVSVYQATDLDSDYHTLTIEVEGRHNTSSLGSNVSISSIEYAITPFMIHGVEEHQAVNDLQWEKFIIGGS